MIFSVLGFYVGVGFSVFWVVLFFVVLGGKSADLWKPFAYSLLWPFFLPYLFFTRRI